MKETGLKGLVEFFSIGRIWYFWYSYWFFSINLVDTNDTLDTHKCLMKITWHKIMFGLIKDIFIELLSSIVNAFTHTKYVCLSKQIQPTIEIQPAILNLHSDEYSQWFPYYLIK